MSSFSGLFGIFGHPVAAKDGKITIGQLSRLALFALQHRGEHYAAVVSSDGSCLHEARGTGLVGEAIQPEPLASLGGEIAIGQVSSESPEEPVMINCIKGQLALGLNGNLMNESGLRRELEALGTIFQGRAHSLLILHCIARSQFSELGQAVKDALAPLVGAYAFLLMSRDELYACRDPHGFRPLCLGRLDEAWVVASETCAFDLIGARYERDVKPGELVRISREGIESRAIAEDKPHLYCLHELVFGARPDSTVYGRSVQTSRGMAGQLLAREHPVEADVVVPVPDSGMAAAIGYAQESKIPFCMGIIRNHYAGRDRDLVNTLGGFDFKVRLKLNPVRQLLEDKIVVLVEDSVLTAETAKMVAALVRQAKPKSVHLRVASPPYFWGCPYGRKLPPRNQLIASRKTEEEIREFLGVQSLGFLSLEALRMAGSDNLGSSCFCIACYTGQYLVGAELCR